MPCIIKNPANADLSSLEPHIQGMYDFFDQKLTFKKPPVMVFDSDPSNQTNVLGKTAYYDPMSLEIHIYSDGRHPKDMLRSIAHELIHHKQNMDNRLDVGGYNGPGYYLENDKLRKIEHEAMLQGNALMREYEDTIKKENNQMSLKEWKNNELNTLLLKKFGILNEDKKPDEDGDGVPDWADEKPGKDDHAEKEEEEVVEEQLETVTENEEETVTENKAEEEEEESKKSDYPEKDFPYDSSALKHRNESKVNLKEVVRKVLENNKRVMQKLKDK